MKKILKTIGIILTIIILNFLSIANSVYAAELGESAKLYNSGKCGDLLKYKGVTIVTTYVTYKDGDDTYPAYCLNGNIPGVGEKGSYTVSTENLVTDVGLWRRLINGYPYKTISELGCQTKEEAFTATKQAIYCYIHGNNPSDYSAIGEAGKRTLKAMKKIISNAEKSTETKAEPTITINKNEGNWEQDSVDKNYVSKTYSVSANANYKTYTISLEKTENSSLPEGIKIVDSNNNEKKTFNKGEKFKVIIPINNLKNNGEFKLNIQSEVDTKPVLYGKAPNSGLQDYALTTLKYEDAKNSTTDSYGENETEIIVYKQDKNSKTPLEGVYFNLLDENKNVIYSALKTDENGKIEIKGIMPGKYYLVETSTLDGYVKYDEDIEIELELNEKFTVTVNNSKEDKKEVSSNETQLEVQKDKTEVSVEEQSKSTTVQKTEQSTVKKLPVTGM